MTKFLRNLPTVSRQIFISIMCTTTKLVYRYHYDHQAEKHISKWANDMNEVWDKVLCADKKAKRNKKKRAANNKKKKNELTKLDPSESITECLETDNTASILPGIKKVKRKPKWTKIIPFA